MQIEKVLVKKTPKQWYEKFNITIVDNDFVVNSSDTCVYSKMIGSDCVIICLYVDDMLIASSCLSMIKELQKNLCKTFEMKDLGDAKKILGMNIERNRTSSTIFLNQTSYIQSVLKNFSMVNSKPSSVPLAAHFQLCKDQCPKTDTE